MAKVSQMLAWASWGLEKSRKRPVGLIPWYLFVFLIKTLSDSLLCAVTGVEHHNLTNENQNISE